MLNIFPAVTKEHYGQTRDLFREYIAYDSTQTKALGLDPKLLLEFPYEQGEEPLPGKYESIEGCLLLATVDDQVAGCGAFHKLEAEVCEMKRLYVRPQYRGYGIGRLLVEALIARAKGTGYAKMKLETVTFMEAAISLYQSFGFQRCDPYCVIPASFLSITVFMELDLLPPRKSAA